MDVLETRGLGRRFGTFTALEDVDLTVPAGTVCALLGRNGAGKSTAVRVLTTLLRPSAGSAHVAGFDVVREAAAVRRRIGVVAQSATMDELLTGYRNLEVIGRLFHLTPSTAAARASELLEQFELSDAAGKQVKTYSGGMRRRLDLAASLIGRPSVLFLDEPTTGLDPIARGQIWRAIRQMVGGGTTVLLTTQYLDEAEELADTVAVLDRGRLVASDTPARLKVAVGDGRIKATLQEPADAPDVAEVLRRVGGGPVEASTRVVLGLAPNGAATLRDAVDELQRRGVVVAELGLVRPSLDEVFARLTGDPAPVEVGQPVLEVA